MSRRLIIRVPPSETSVDGQTRVQWKVFEEVTSVTEANTCTLEQLKTSIDSIRPESDISEVVVLLSGKLVSHQQKTINQGQQKHLASALPYLMEDDLVGDVGQLHFSCDVLNHLKDENLVVSVSAIRHADMQNLLTELDKQQLSPDKILAEAQLLNMGNESVHVLLEDKQAIIRGPYTLCLTVEPEALPFALMSLHEEVTNQESSELHLYYFNSKNIPSDSISGLVDQLHLSGWAINLQPELGMPIDYLAKKYVSEPTAVSVNLLSGEYRRQKASGLNQRRIKALLAIAACWLVLETGLLIGEGLFFKYRSEQFWQDSAQQYLSLFPQDRQVLDAVSHRPGSVDIKNRLSSRFQAGQTTQKEPSFLPLLAKVSVPNEQEVYGQVQPKHLSFNHKSRQMQLEFETDSLATVDQFLAALKQVNVEGQLDSANQRDGDVIARLTLENN